MVYRLQWNAYFGKKLVCEVNTDVNISIYIDRYAFSVRNNNDSRAFGLRLFFFLQAERVATFCWNFTLCQRKNKNKKDPLQIHKTNTKCWFGKLNGRIFLCLFVCFFFCAKDSISSPNRHNDVSDKKNKSWYVVMSICRRFVESRREANNLILL